ncbi:vesicle transport v-SNARE 12 [Chrysoperla carnea]|uniref:vesicle transport v-SNARE 12 n=1 Tax=Chrysoperla carnea TaxID=189513 RepID=UPI001D09759F|nr:vesicle transport v-SNARE 12 [Chrysoperla carnea]XP_044730395.1 vesicle transport v-SNARE 12 [Chrysoperla carnea]
MTAFGDYDWENENRRIAMEGRAALERTSESLARTTRVAIETEHIGTTVVNELEEQRETLLRANERLHNANDGLDQSKNIMRRMGREVLYNKCILIMIILLEAMILGILLYLKLR